MCEKKEKVALSDLILAAVCYLQEKNGVTACEIAEFISQRRGCKVSQIEGMVKMVLCKAKAQGILCDKKGLYRIEERYDDAAIQSKKEGNQGPVELSEDSDDEDGDEDDEDEEKALERKQCDPCAGLKLSQDNLSDDDEGKQCGQQKPKKRKCC